MTKNLTLILGVFASLIIFDASGQDLAEQSYLDQVFQETAKKREASYVRQLKQKDTSTYQAEVKTMKGSLRMTGEYLLNSQALLEHGKFTFYYDDGSVESSGYYEKGVKVGSWERYTADGSRRPDRYYNPESADFIRDVMAGE
jgi:antitoxin component YwqK of YwqJK toxin-antitoxin module